MVQKIAVIALVAILAVPILMGYAMNLTETTESDYKSSNDSLNVTPLLFNTTRYTYSHGDINKLNTNLGTYGYHKTIPIYENITTTSTSYPLAENVYTNQSYPGVDQGTSFLYFYEQMDYNPGAVNVIAQLYKTVGGVESSIGNVGYFHSISFDQTTGTIEVLYYNGDSDHVGYISYTGNLTRINFISSGTVNTTYVASYDNNNTYYADFASGFHFIGNYHNWFYLLPNYTQSTLFTIDLNSITDSTYSIVINDANTGYRLEKYTNDGVVTWYVRDHINPTRVFQLYYDQTASSNTYQIYWDVNKRYEDSSYKYYTSSKEFRYVGDWPMAIGEANIYWTLEDSVDFGKPISDPDINFNYINFNSSSSNRSPTMRVDDAYFRAFEYQVIYNQTYTPNNFKTNPRTTIEDVNIYGSSISFGGINYAVNEGNITLGSHQIPVNGIVLSSVPNSNGTYDNKIGNTVISTTAQPSTIKFNGYWSASVSTESMESYTYTKTEWHAGSFGWNGIDQNFLMVGLLTSVGVFILLGLYARRTRSGGIIPLMIVSGGAAMIFFIML